jgi:arylsulfatase A-like enzyme
VGFTAQIDRMDQGIGRIIQALEKTGQLANTLIMFLADNGGCAEELGSEPGRVVFPAESTRDGRPAVKENDPSVMPGLGAV